MTQTNRKLFLSFTGLLYALKSGKVSQSDLDNGFFYFGCTREHVRCPGASGESNEVEWAYRGQRRAGLRTLRRINHAINKAAKEGRVMFRQMGEGNSYKTLNHLLNGNGYRSLDPYKTLDETGTPFALYNYSYPHVEMVVKHHRLPLDVVWR